MASSVSGLSTQSNLYSMIQQLMSLERQPIYRLESKKTDLQTLSSIYSDLKTNLKALRSAAEDISDPLDSTMDSRAVSSSDSDVVTMTATTSAALGAHSIFVTQLAKHHTMVADRFTGSSTSIRTALGTGDQTFSITVNGTATQVTVTIEADDTDEDIIDATAAAINTAMADVDDAVAATALDDTSTTSKLILRSDGTGTTYKMTLADVSGSLLSTLGIDNEAVAATDTTGGYIYADSELDAKLDLDGVSITRDTNVIEDALNGITITLHGHQEAGDDPVDVTVRLDSESIRGTVNTFLEKYNDALAYLRAKTSVDSSGVRQPLSHQYIYRSLISNIRSAAAGVYSTGVSTIQMLAHIGITADSEGALSISDSDEFDDALEADPAAVAALFNGADGLADTIEDLLDPFVNTGGYIDTNRTNTETKISSIDESIERLEARMTLKEARYIKQYSSLQASLAVLSQQQNFLGSFLGWS